MKTMIFALIFSMISTVVFAQNKAPTTGYNVRISSRDKPLMQKNEWRPYSYSAFSNFEQKMIERLNVLDNTNRSLVQMFSEIGEYQDCTMSIVVEEQRIIVKLVDQKTSLEHSYSLITDKALISTESIINKDIPLYVLVFDKDVEGTPETFFMYFYFSPEGTIKSIQVQSRTQTETESFGCKSK